VGSVIALSAQFGGAKLADGLYRLVGERLCVIVNTGDDHEHLGLLFTPDLDTVLYTLSGLGRCDAGWEPEGESYAFADMLARLGGPTSPRVGDRALATAVLRSAWLREERRLSEIAQEFARRLGVRARILPMSDDPVRTHALTDGGALPFPEYFYAFGCEPRVRGFQYAGAAEARVTEEVREALLAPDVEAVVIGPANPYHGIGPILALPGMREVLRATGAPVVAVSPIVGGKALRGSLGKMMRELGREASARAIALDYRGMADGFALDPEDAALADGLRASGLAVLVTPLVMRSAEDRAALAARVLEFARSLRSARRTHHG